MENYFKFSTPEACGVQSPHIGAFLDRLEEKNYTMHSYLMARHGHIFAEGYFAPFQQSDFHRMFSISKTFVSTAVGLLQDEGRLSLSDPVARFFPDKLPENLHPYLQSATIRDLLMMAGPFKGSFTYGPDKLDWVKAYFDTTPDHPAGTYFNYDTSGTYLVNAIVERVAGQPFLEYLKDKLLRAAGFSEDTWCLQAPEGYSWGGSGVFCTTRDLARLAQIYLDGGNVHGQQLLSASYVREATTRQIDNCTNGWRTSMEGNGYGYQIWVTVDGGFAFLGMGEQIAYVRPDLDFIFICTGDLQGYPSSYHCVPDLVRAEILDKMQAEPCPEAPQAVSALRQREAGLQFPVTIPGADTSPLAGDYCGHAYVFGENDLGFETMRLDISGHCGTLTYTARGAEKVWHFGMGTYVQDQFPETHYFGRRECYPGGYAFKCMHTARWAEPHKLLIRTYIADDHYANLCTTISFKGDSAVVYMMKTAEWFLDEYEGLAVGQRAR